MCNYTTEKSFNYDRHMKSRKHQKKTKEGKNNKCKFCGKGFSTYHSLLRHHDICMDKKIHDMEEKHNKRVEDEIRKRDNLLKEQQIEHLSHINEIEKDYRDIIKNIAPSALDHKTINNNSINMYYVMNNFNDALDYQKIMDEPITDDEKKMLLETGSVEGCCELIKNRCVDNIGLNERPIHCVDVARLKFMIHVDGEWSSDIRGKRLVDAVAPKVYKIFMDHAKVSEDNEIKLKMMNESVNLMNNKTKIANQISDYIILNAKNKICS